MTYFTEQELLARFEYYTLALEDQIREGESFDSLGNDIPFAVHLNDAQTLEVRHTNSKHSELTGHCLDEIAEMGAEFLAKCVHPKSLEFLPTYLPPAYGNRQTHQTFCFIQHVLLRKPKVGFAPIVTFTKPTSLASGLVVCLSPVLSDFGRFSQQMQRVVEIDEFKLKNLARFKTLTQRELEVLQLLALGENNRRVSDVLAISRQTVETHRKKIRSKLGATSYRDLLKYAVAFNLVKL